MKTSKTILLAAFLIGTAVASVREFFPSLWHKVFGSPFDKEAYPTPEFPTCVSCEAPISSWAKMWCKPCEEKFAPKEVHAA